MDGLVIIGIIFAFIILIFIAIKYGRDFAKFIIYVLTIPLWIWGMIYYNDIRIYILFGLILVWDIFYICFYIKESGWLSKNKNKKR